MKVKRRERSMRRKARRKKRRKGRTRRVRDEEKGKTGKENFLLKCLLKKREWEYFEITAFQLLVY